MNYASPEARAFLEKAAVAEYAHRLSQEGWEVQQEATLEDRRGPKVDLLARRGDRTLFVEFKRVQPGAGWADQLRALRAAAADEGAEFRLVLLPTPGSTEAEVAEIDRILFDALLDDVPYDLATLSSDTRIDDVEGTIIDRIRVGPDGIDIEGISSVTVTLQSGEGDAIDTIAVPLQFSGCLDREQHLVLQETKFDLSVWYGDAA